MQVGLNETHHCVLELGPIATKVTQLLHDILSIIVVIVSL